jgi:predicted PolB exonuclease-like 3'-5' exonuclease
MAVAKINNILFLDIETVPLTYSYQEMHPVTQELWNKKWAYNRDQSPEQMYSKAGVFAEFAKIICIGLGFYNEGKFRVRTIAGDDEKELLNEFVNLITRHFDSNEHYFCAHNGKEFDFPFLCRRMIIHGITLPNNLRLQGKKPWEVKHLDTMEMWRFGDIKNFTSLNLLAHILGIPSPKDDMDGSQVSKVYYEEKNLNKIKDYCVKDVVTLARVYQRYTGSNPVTDNDIVLA